MVLSLEIFTSADIGTVIFDRIGGRWTVIGRELPTQGDPSPVLVLNRNSDVEIRICIRSHFHYAEIVYALGNDLGGFLVPYLNGDTVVVQAPAAQMPARMAI